MAGSISLSLSQQFNGLGQPLNGGLLYFYAAGTTAPQTAYKDVALTLAHPNPIELDAAGRVPAFYLADGQIKIRLTDSAGIPQITADNLLVIGPSSGAGSPPSVDPTTLLQTGWMQHIYGTGSVTGFVRANGRTIGSASSGASERANADALALFTFLYNADSNLSVSGGRGADAPTDWAANKQLSLPDLRGRSLAGLDDMGNAAAGRLTLTYFGSTPTILGAASSAEKQALSSNNLPSFTIPGVVGTGHGFILYQPGATGSPDAPNGSANVNYTGTNTPVVTVGPRLLTSIYLKL